MKIQHNQRKYMSHTVTALPEYFRLHTSGDYQDRVWFDGVHENIARYSTAEDCPEGVLWMSVDEVDMVLYLSVYSPEERAYTFKAPRTGTTVEDIDSFIQEVEAYYQATLPAMLRAQAVMFVENLHGAFNAKGPTSSAHDMCQQCSDEEAELMAAFYYPEFIAGQGDYLMMWKKCGLLGAEERYAGPVSEIGEEVLSIMEHMLTYMDEPDTKQQVQKFVDQLKKVMAT
jgi:hypothetical protein